MPNVAHHGPAGKEGDAKASEYKKELAEIAPKTNTKDGNWVPGDAPSQVLERAISSLAKAGTLSIIGVYPMTAKTFPIGMAMNRNLTVKMGNCNHRKYVPKLVTMAKSRSISPEKILTNVEPIMSAIDAYKAFDKREPGWIKVEPKPAAVAALA